MFYELKNLFKDHRYHAWLKARIKALEEAIKNNLPLDHTDDTELLKRKLASYKQAEADLAEIYGISNEADNIRK
jgi:hypothetical protein